MQLVTLEDLKKLAQIDSISESEASDNLGFGVSFKDICKKYDAHKIELEKRFRSQQSMHSWPNAMSSWMKSTLLPPLCPPIMLVGVGSSRTAYACLGGKCLKVAYNESGIAQNKQEEKSTKKHWWSRGYSCFAQTYASSSDYGMLLTECCAAAKDGDQLAKSFKMSGSEVFLAVVKAVSEDKKYDLDSASSSLKSMATDLKKKGQDFSAMLVHADVADEAAQWLDQVMASSSKSLSPGQKSFMQLVKFWKKNGTSALLPGDVQNDKNWGFAVRDGRIAPVLLDAGFSQDVAKKYY